MVSEAGTYTIVSRKREVHVLDASLEEYQCMIFNSGIP